MSAPVVIPETDKIVAGAGWSSPASDAYWFFFSPRQLKHRNFTTFLFEDHAAATQLRLFQLCLDFVNRVRQSGEFRPRPLMADIAFVCHTEVPCGPGGSGGTGHLFGVVFNHTASLGGHAPHAAAADQENVFADPVFDVDPDAAVLADGDDGSSNGGEGRAKRGRPSRGGADRRSIHEQGLSKCMNMAEALERCNAMRLDIDSAPPPAAGGCTGSVAIRIQYSRMAPWRYTLRPNHLHALARQLVRATDDIPPANAFTVRYQRDPENPCSLMALFGLRTVLDRMRRSAVEWPFTDAGMYEVAGELRPSPELQLRLINTDVVTSPSDVELWIGVRGFHPDAATRAEIATARAGDATLSYIDAVRRVVGNTRAAAAPDFRSLEDLRQHMYEVTNTARTQLSELCASGEDAAYNATPPEHRELFVLMRCARTARELIRRDLVPLQERMYGSASPAPNLHRLAVALQEFAAARRVTHPEHGEVYNFTVGQRRPYHNVAAPVNHLITMMHAMEQLGCIHLHLLGLLLQQRWLTVMLLATMRSHTLMIGPPSTGKSALVALVARLWPAFMVEVIGYATKHAPVAAGQVDYTVQLEHEADETKLDGSDREATAFTKSRLDPGSLTRREPRRDATGNWVVESTTLPGHLVITSLTNHGGMDPAVRTRVHAANVISSRRLLPNVPDINRVMRPDGKVVQLEEQLRFANMRDAFVLSMWSSLWTSGATTERLFRYCGERMPHTQFMEQFRSMQRIWNMTVVCMVRRVNALVFDYPYSPLHNRPLSFHALSDVINTCMYPLPCDLVFAVSAQSDEADADAMLAQLFTAIRARYFSPADHIVPADDADGSGMGTPDEPERLRRALQPYLLVERNATTGDSVTVPYRVCVPVPNYPGARPLSEGARRSQAGARRAGAGGTGLARFLDAPQATVGGGGGATGGSAGARRRSPLEAAAECRRLIATDLEEGPLKRTVASATLISALHAAECMRVDHDDPATAQVVSVPLVEFVQGNLVVFLPALLSDLQPAGARAAGGAAAPPPAAAAAAAAAAAENSGSDDDEYDDDDGGGDGGGGGGAAAADEHGRGQRRRGGGDTQAHRAARRERRRQQPWSTQNPMLEILLRALSHRHMSPRKQVYVLAETSPDHPMELKTAEVVRCARRELELPPLRVTSQLDDFIGNVLTSNAATTVDGPAEAPRATAFQPLRVTEDLVTIARTEHMTTNGLLPEDYTWGEGAAAVNLWPVVDPLAWAHREESHFAAHPRDAPAHTFPQDWRRSLAAARPAQFVPILRRAGETAIADAVAAMPPPPSFDPRQAMTLLAAAKDHTAADVARTNRDDRSDNAADAAAAGADDAPAAPAMAADGLREGGARRHRGAGAPAAAAAAASDASPLPSLDSGSRGSASHELLRAYGDTSVNQPFRRTFSMARATSTVFHDTDADRRAQRPRVADGADLSFGAFYEREGVPSSAPEPRSALTATAAAAAAAAVPEAAAADAHDNWFMVDM